MSNNYLEVRRNLKGLIQNLQARGALPGEAVVYQDIDGDGNEDGIIIQPKWDHYKVIARLSNAKGAETYFAIPTKNGIPPSSTFAVDYDEASGKLRIGPFTLQVFGETHETDDILLMGETLAFYFPPWVIQLLAEGIPGELAPFEIIYGDRNNLRDYFVYLRTLGRIHWTDDKINRMVEATKEIKGSGYPLDDHNSDAYNLLFLIEATLPDWIVPLQSMGREFSRYLYLHEFTHVADTVLQRKMAPRSGVAGTVVYLNIKCPGFSEFMDVVEKTGAFPSRYVRERIYPRTGHHIHFKRMEYFADMNVLRQLGVIKALGLAEHPEYDRSFFALQMLLLESFGDADVFQSICQNAGNVLALSPRR